MDDANESELLYEVCTILLRFSARTFKGIRADIDQIELQNLILVQEKEFEEVGNTSYTFIPHLLTLFGLGLLAIIVRNERVQGLGILVSRCLRRWLRKLRTGLIRLAVNLGPIRKNELLHIHMRNPGTTWELKSDSGHSACFAVQGRRPKMEDRFTLIENLGKTPLHLFAVYDGHGGEFAADYAQRWIVNWLEKRSATYKTKPVLHKHHTPPLTCIQQTIAIDEVSPDESKRREEVHTSAIRRNSLSQLEDSSKQLDKIKTPSLKRRSLGGEGLQASLGQLDSLEPSSQGVPRGSSAKERRGSVTMTRSGSGSSFTRNINALFAKRQSIGAEWDLSQELTKAIMESDKALIVEAKKRNDVAGTTALVALLDSAHGQLAVANVGDSRGILCDAKGTVIPLSFDHKPQQVREERSMLVTDKVKVFFDLSKLKERKRIQEAGGFISFNGVWRVAGILATSRALGDFPLKDRKLLISEPDVLSFDLHDLRLHQPSFLILASDGLWDAFSNEEAALYVRQRLGEPHMGAKSLAMQAYQRGSVDNITVLVINLSKV